VPVLRQLEEFTGEPAAGYIHWGATTQNIFDTGVALQMQRTHALIDASLQAAMGTLAKLAIAHRDTLQAGRTHGQHALPMTFGFKVAGWLEEIRRDHKRLHDRIGPSFVACLGGAIGTFAAMGDKGPAVEAEMAAILGLEPAVLPMRSSFDRANDYFCALGLLAGTADKIAHDIVFMQRTEIAEVEQFDHGPKTQPFDGTSADQPLPAPVRAATPADGLDAALGRRRFLGIECQRRRRSGNRHPRRFSG
jgi:adenylosuccinate lyase/3-carboxy-cis,cis-muconate cycloisomerase